MKPNIPLLIGAVALTTAILIFVLMAVLTLGGCSASKEPRFPGLY